MAQNVTRQGTARERRAPEVYAWGRISEAEKAGMTDRVSGPHRREAERPAILQEVDIDLPAVLIVRLQRSAFSILDGPAANGVGHREGDWRAER